MPSEFALVLREPVTITLAGTEVTLPYRPAAVWAKAIADVKRVPVASTLADEAARDLITDLLIEHPGVAAQLRAESLRILGEAAGRSWWEAGRLISTSVSPEVLGRLVLAGVDPWSRSLGEWCAATYALCVKGQDDKGRLRFDFMLSLPPAGHEDEWDDGGNDPAEIQANLAKMQRKR